MGEVRDYDPVSVGLEGQPRSDKPRIGPKFLSTDRRDRKGLRYSTLVRGNNINDNNNTPLSDPFCYRLTTYVYLLANSATLGLLVLHEKTLSCQVKYPQRYSSE